MNLSKARPGTIAHCAGATWRARKPSKFRATVDHIASNVVDDQVMVPGAVCPLGGMRQIVRPLVTSDAALQLVRPDALTCFPNEANPDMAAVRRA